MILTIIDSCFAYDSDDGFYTVTFTMSDDSEVVFITDDWAKAKSELAR